MKKFIAFILMLFAFVLTCIPAFSQVSVDTTGITNSWSGILTDILNFIAGYVPTPSWVVLLLTVLLLIEQWLAKTKKVQANSTFQLILQIFDKLAKTILGKTSTTPTSTAENANKTETDSK